MGPTVSESFFHLGVVSRAQGDMVAARSAFRTAALLDPNGEYGQQSATALSELAERGGI